MAKQQRITEIERNKRTAQYIRYVMRQYDVTADELVKATRHVALTGGKGKVFSFNDFPSLKGIADKEFKNFAKSLLSIINTATEAEWIKACKDVDAEIDRIMKTAAISKERLKSYGDRNLTALTEFQTRKFNGMNLSDRVWNYTEQFRQEIELALDIGIGEGKSAAELSRDVRQYLREPDKLFRRVRDKHGDLVLSKAAKAYNPGRGVYRSSFKNARRMTATETNIAYRTADHTRWQNFDFVVGFEVKLSNNHTINGKPFTDICDVLAGKYPKDFKFVGWHPLCRCFAVPILITQKEMIERNRAAMAGEDVSEMRSVNAVGEVPEGFKKWVDDNRERIEKAKKRGTLPYFLRDNMTQLLFK
jgi:predicted RNA-binding protein YlxR (DUF448 family)